MSHVEKQSWYLKLFPSLIGGISQPWWAGALRPDEFKVHGFISSKKIYVLCHCNFVTYHILYQFLQLQLSNTESKFQNYQICLLCPEINCCHLFHPLAKKFGSNQMKLSVLSSFKHTIAFHIETSHLFCLLVSKWLVKK